MIKKLHSYMLELLEAEKIDLLSDLMYIIDENITCCKNDEEDFDNLKYEILQNMKLIEFFCNKDLYIELLDYKIKKDNSKHEIYNKEKIWDQDIIFSNLDRIYEKYSY